MELNNEMMQKGWLSNEDIVNNGSYGVYGMMYKLINTYDPDTGGFGLENSVEARNAYLENASLLNTDWFSELYSSVMLHCHTVSLSGGTQKVAVYASLGAMIDPGWSMRSAVERYTSIVNVTFDPIQSLRFDINARGAFRNQEAPGMVENNLSGSKHGSFDINPYSYATNTSRAMSADVEYRRNFASFNIKQELNNNYINLSSAEYNLTGAITWEAMTGLTLHAYLSFWGQQTEIDHDANEMSNYANAYRGDTDV